jgi:hypothetical protein
MGRTPGILEKVSQVDSQWGYIVAYHISTPLQPSKEYNQTSNTDESTNEVNATNNLLSAHSSRIDSRGREIKEDRNQ